jgi:hypothetical protein
MIIANPATSPGFGGLGWRLPGLSDRLCRLLRDQERCRRLVDRARLLVRNGFTFTAQAGHYASQFDSIAGTCVAPQESLVNRPGRQD